jgi:hypothetical protein
MTFCSCDLVRHHLLVFFIEVLIQILLLCINLIQIVRLVHLIVFNFTFF